MALCWSHRHRWHAVWCVNNELMLRHSTVLTYAPGYDTGVISGVLVVIGSDLDNKPITDSNKELITAMCAAGALVGSIIAGVTGDKYGRRPAIWFASILFTLGAIIQASSFTMAQMVVGRFLIGLGVGSASMVGLVT